MPLTTAVLGLDLASEIFEVLEHEHSLMDVLEKLKQDKPLQRGIVTAKWSPL